MITQLQPIKDRIDSNKRATRDDIHEALLIIVQNGENPESEITELVENVYDADKTAKLISDLDSYQT